MLIRRTLAGIAALSVFATISSAQTQQAATVSIAPMVAGADPSFEVATIRLARSDEGQESQNEHIDGRHVGFVAYPVIDMICLAYNIYKSQVIDAPAWFSERYDVDGVTDTPGQPSIAQFQRMTQKLLADRFGLRFHHDKRMLSVYVLAIAKGGPKLTKSSADPNALADIGGSGNAAQRTRTFGNITMKDFALTTQFQIGRPILDQTGLTGHYDFTLTWGRDDAPPDANAPPSFFTAIQEQLGLKMEPKKDLADVLVIDHAERPSEN